MKTIGTILLVFALLNFLVAVFAACIGEAYMAGNKLSSSLLVGLIGGILYYFGNKKGEPHIENDHLPQKRNEDNFWQTYKRISPTKAVAIEKITQKDFSQLSDADVREIVGSMERWAKNLNCPIQDIRKTFLNTYKSVFANDDTKEIIGYLRNEKMREEANHFHISTNNTCTFYMIKWLEDTLPTQEQPKNTPKMTAKNKMSANEFVKNQGAEIKFHDFEGNDGKKHTYFTCGEITGYVSPNAIEYLRKSNYNLDYINYAEVSKDGEKPVPCLMLTTMKHEKAFETSQSQNKPQMITKNKMSAKELIKEQEAEIKYYDFKDNEGKQHTFFTCGEITGYISPNAKKELEKDDCDLDNLEYAEVSKDGKEFVPCLLAVVFKPKKTFNVEKEEKSNNSPYIFPVFGEADKIKKEFEIKSILYQRMLNFIQSMYGEITGDINNPNVLTTPLANAQIMFEDDEELNSLCNRYGLNYSKMLEAVSKKIVEHYSTENNQNEDLPF